MAVNRKEAIREYKERKTPRGIFSVKCAPTGQMWAGSSPNLDAARNGIWFALRLGTHLNKGLQAEWNAHGEEAFHYDVLEKFDDDVTPVALNDMFKARTRHWLDHLGALSIL